VKTKTCGKHEKLVIAFRVNFNPQKILVINFGQLGDVVLSFPALKAIREKFPQSWITVLTGKACAQIVELSGFADSVTVVDRVALRDGNKIISIGKIFRLVQKVRRERFDFVIDLHSLPETNILGFLSGASDRLFAQRENRSIDWLSNFTPKPPIEDKSKHTTDKYLDVLLPLGIKDAPRTIQLTPHKEDLEAVEKIFKKKKVRTDVPIVGLFPGAGHSGRRWALENFSEVANLFANSDGLQVVAICGPEEKELLEQARKMFPSSVCFLDKLTLTQLAAATTRLSILISNDTGPMHIAAATGTPIVVLVPHPTLKIFVPIGEHHRAIHTDKIEDITVEEVYAAAREVLSRNRTAAIING
jgi:ADP-heptose:LPS heptosyltransferase